jgi:hypothetical protein
LSGFGGVWLMNRLPAMLVKSRDEEKHIKKCIDLLLHSIVLDCLPEYCNKITPLNAFRKYSL